jgi:Uma2 family endonuclease
MKAIVEGMTFPVTIPQGFRITPEQFEQLANVEQLVRLELTARGELIVMSPTGGTAGRKNSRLTQKLRNWADQNGQGEVFDSSTVFVLPSGARRSPDVSWIELERWNQLTPAQQDGFPPLAPDFVIELVSPSDLKSQRYQDLQAKMQEYLDNGVKLGWLIEPSAKTVEIYRSRQPVEILNNPQSLSGESVLPGFTLDLTEIFTT